MQKSSLIPIHRPTFGNPTPCGIAILVAFFDTGMVLTLASNSFAFYYTLQCMVAFKVSKDRNQKIDIALVTIAIRFERST